MQWFYQTCSEFGFYQTCDPDSACPFTRHPHLNNLHSYTQLCDKVFGRCPVLLLLLFYCLSKRAPYANTLEEASVPVPLCRLC